MTVDEFASALYEIYREKAAAPRYTVTKRKTWLGILPSRKGVRVARH